MGTLVPVSGGSPGTKKRIDRLMQRALEADCQPSHKVAPVTFIDASPSAAMRNTLGVLRRPQAATETLSASEFYLPIRRIRRSSVRFVKSGTRDYVIFVADSIQVRPRKCASQVKRRYAQLVRGESRAFRLRARRALKRLIKVHFRSHEAAYLFIRHPGGEYLEIRAGSSVSQIRGGGTYGTGGDAGPGLSLLTGLAPDPVATITARFGTETQLTASVVENTVTFEVPGSSMDAFPSRQVWRDADGNVVRVLTGD
jgi:hypothetical protein